MTVAQVQQINGDLLPDGGVLNYAGDVHITGNARGHFILHGSGSVIIDGAVEYATIYAQKEIVLGDNAQNAVFFTGEHLTMLNGKARDCRFCALRGLHLNIVEASMPQASILTAGINFLLAEKVAEFEGVWRYQNTAQQDLVNRVHEELEAVAKERRSHSGSSSGRLKKSEERPDERLWREILQLYENVGEMQKIEQHLQMWRNLQTLDGVPEIICEKQIHVGCVITLNEVREMITNQINGRTKWTLTADKKIVRN